MSHSPTASPRQKSSRPVPKSPPSFPGTWVPLSVSLILPVLVLLLPSPCSPSWCCLQGQSQGTKNITARFGKPLVLNCKGAPKKPPQQLEWKLVSGAPVSPLLGTPVRFRPPLAPPPFFISPFPQGGLHCEAPLLYPQNTGRTEAWKVLSPRETPGIAWLGSSPTAPSSCRLLGSRMRDFPIARATSRSGKETKSNYRVRVYRRVLRTSSPPTSHPKEKPSTPALDSLALAWERNLTSAAPIPHPWCENLQSCGL